MSELLLLEDRIDRSLDFVRVFELWDSPFPTNYHNQLIASERKMLLSVRARRLNGQFMQWRDIANATPGSPLHNDMVRWIESVRAVGEPVWFTFNHEPEVVNHIASGIDQDFIAAWQRVISEFRTRGVTNVEFVWIMTDYSFYVPSSDRRHAPKWYPGDNFVDHIAADAYNWSDCRPGQFNNWKPLQEIIEPLRQFGTAHPDKGLMLAEWASADTQGDKAAWISQAAALFKQPGWEQFIAVSYFDRIDPTYPACNFPINSTSAVQTAFAAMGADTFYGGGTPPPPPPPPTTILSGIADASGATGARWQSVLYTPTQTGQHRFVLSWPGSANLRMDIRQASNNAWVGGNTSLDQPKVMNVTLTSGTAYRLAVWAVSGAANFTATVTPPGATVDPPPTVSITSPVSGAILSGPVTLTADASDNTAVTSVAFTIDGTTVGTDSNGADGWSLVWDSTTAIDGPHQVGAVATDTANQTTTATPVPVTVDNVIAPGTSRNVILITVDGFIPAAIASLGPAGAPNFHRMLAEGAGTLNARTVFEATQTLPNHTSVYTGRTVSGASGHGVTFNEDSGGTVHDTAGETVESIFDGAEADGLRTSLFASKPKFDFYDRSWPVIDYYERGGGSQITFNLLAQLGSATPPNLAVVHYADPDGAGHQFGFMSTQYLNTVANVDGWIGDILDEVAADPDLASDTIVIVTADHGGGGTNHADPSLAVNYTIPFMVWGAGVTPGVDLYDINLTSRQDPATSRPNYAAAPQPIRNADAANLAMEHLELAPIAESSINSGQNLEIAGTPPSDLPPTVSITAPASGATVSGNVTITATASDDQGVAQVEFRIDGAPIGVDSSGGDGWSLVWNSSGVADGAHAIGAVATDTAQQTASATAVPVTVDNAPGSAILMVVGNPAGLVSSETSVRDRLLNAGHTVTVSDDDGIQASAANGMSLLLISYTVDTQKVANKFLNVPTPVWMAKPWLFDDMEMTGPVDNTDYGIRSTQTLVIVDSTHPMAAGRSGTVNFMTSRTNVSWGQAEPAAARVATVNNLPSIFAFQPGDVLDNGAPASGCRIAFPLYQDGPTRFTADAWAMFDATVSWAVSGCP